MKRTSYLLSILFILVLTVFASCKDDEVTETEEEAKTRLLTSGAFTVDEVSLGSGDYTFQGPATINFEDNNTFTITGNEALPNPVSTPTDALPASGEWSFTDTQNFNAIALTSGGTTVDLTISTLSESDLVFRYQGAEPKPTDEVAVTVSASR